MTVELVTARRDRLGPLSMLLGFACAGALCLRNQSWLGLAGAASAAFMLAVGLPLALWPGHAIEVDGSRVTLGRFCTRAPKGASRRFDLEQLVEIGREEDPVLLAFGFRKRVPHLVVLGVRPAAPERNGLVRYHVRVAPRALRAMFDPGTPRDD